MMCGSSSGAFSRIRLRGGIRSRIVPSVARMSVWSSAFQLYRSRSSATITPQRTTPVAVSRRTRSNVLAYVSSSPRST